MGFLAAVLLADEVGEGARLPLRESEKATLSQVFQTLRSGQEITHSLPGLGDAVVAEVRSITPPVWGGFPLAAALALSGVSVILDSVVFRKII